MTELTNVVFLGFKRGYQLARMETRREEIRARLWALGSAVDTERDPATLLN